MREPTTIKIPYRFGRFIGIIVLVSIVVAIFLPFLIVAIEPPIDVVGTMFMAPYPTGILDSFLWMIKNSVYQLSWKVPIMTLWFYSVYIVVIFFVAKEMRVFELLPEPPEE
jgi:hypothetical protein